MPSVTAELREYFDLVTEASPSDARRWIVARHQERVLGAGLPSPDIAREIAELVPKAVSYQGVVNRFYWLRQVGIIEYARSEPARGFAKNFYRIVEGKRSEFLPGIQYRLYPSAIWGGERYKGAQRRGLVEPGRAVNQGTASPVGHWVNFEPIEVTEGVSPPPSRGEGREAFLDPNDPNNWPGTGWYFPASSNGLEGEIRLSYFGPSKTEQEAMLYAEAQNPANLMPVRFIESRTASPRFIDLENFHPVDIENYEIITEGLTREQRRLGTPREIWQVNLGRLVDATYNQPFSDIRSSIDEFTEIE
jgi:hypothetical protein